MIPAWLHNFTNAGDPKIVFAFWLGMAVVAVTVVMLVVIIGMRQVVSRRERVHLTSVARWAGILATTGAPHLPPVRRSDARAFLTAWINRASREDADLVAARTQAAAAGLERHALRLLGSGDFNDRILAVTALGHYGGTAHFQRIAALLENNSPIVSLCAAAALMRMDTARAVSLFVPQIVRRDDWARGRIAAILHDAHDRSVATALSEATLRANADLAPRLLRFLAVVSPDDASRVIRAILRTSGDDHLISTCLQVMTNPADLDIVRPLVGHARWHLRLQAASVLGRLGEAEDKQYLVRLLSDREWWVRYRAAQALANLPAMDQPALDALGRSLTDKFALDILGHVMAEKKLGLVA